MSARIEEIRQENRSGDVSYRDIEWLCAEVDRLRDTLRMIRHDPDWPEISGWLTIGQQKAIEAALEEQA